jgi:hypothetical protein
MSTSVENTPQVTRSGHSPASIWPFMPGLLWGALLLGILGWWLFISDLDVGTPIASGVLLAAAVGLGLFVWATLQWWKARNDGAKLAQLDTGLKPIVALALFAGAALLVFLGAWLYVQNGVRVFAQVSSMAVMALICAGAGLALQHPVTRPQIFQWMLHRRREIAIVLMVLGVVIGGAGVYFLFFYEGGLTNFRSNFPGGPEGLGMILIGAVLLGGGLYTFLNLDRPAFVDTMRFLCLYTVSMTGFVLSLFTAVRMSAWWVRYFMPGMSAWQGNDSWHFWLCIYMLVLGLVLLFGGLLLGRVDIRVNVSMRRMLYGYNTVLTGFLLLVILVVLVIFTFVNLPANIAWNRMGMHTISEKSRQTLAELKDRVKVYVLLQRFGDTYFEVSDLLDNCQSETDKLVVEYISPDMDAAAYRDLASVYPELEKQTKSDFRGSGGYGRGLLVVYGEGPEGKNLPHVFIPDRDLQDADPTGQTIAFKGENTLMNAIRQLANKQSRPKVYFTQSNGELMLKDIDQQDSRILHFPGAEEVTDRLRKAGYDVYGLFWEAQPRGVPGMQIPDVFKFARKTDKDEPKVPEDCNVLVIAGPEEAFSKEVLKAIDTYLDKGGKIVVLTKAGMMGNGQFTDDGMPEFCKKLGAELKNDFVLRWSDKTKQEAWMIQAKMAPQNNSNLAKAFTGKWFKFILPRDVRPLKTPGKYQAEVLLEAPPENNGNLILIDNNIAGVVQPIAYLRDLRNRDLLESKMSKDPVPLAVAITDKDNKPRGFIFGDDGFISSFYLKRDPPQGSIHFDLFRSCLEVLVERPLPDLGITPTERGTFLLQKTDEITWGRILWLPMGLMIVALAGTGAGIWIVRRK